MTDIRHDLYNVVLEHFDKPLELSEEILFLAATTQIALGKTPEEASETFHSHLAHVVKTITQASSSPLAQVVTEEA